jgi:hypothetical protein
MPEELETSSAQFNRKRGPSKNSAAADTALEPPAAAFGSAALPIAEPAAREPASLRRVIGARRDDRSPPGRWKSANGSALIASMPQAGDILEKPPASASGGEALSQHEGITRKDRAAFPA